MFTQFAVAVRHSPLAISHSTVSCWFFSLYQRVLLPCCAIMLAAGCVTAATGQTLAPGQMKGWGYDEAGQAELPIVSPPLDNISAISASTGYTAALRNNGTIVVWGSNPPTVAPVQKLFDITAIAATRTFLMALRRNGTVAFMGDVAQAGPFVDGSLTDVIAIAANDTHAMALKRNGTVIDWKVSDGSLIQVPVGLPVVTAIAAGKPHSLALLYDGTVASWGQNGISELDVPISQDKFVAVAAAFLSSFALRMDGSVAAWGNSSVGLLDGAGAQTNIKALSAGLFHVLAVNVNNEVQAWGENSYERISIPTGIKNAKAVAAGPWNSFALNPAPLLSPYTFSGFQRPVDGAPTINIGRAGRTYPVKWQLKDGAGGFVSSLSTFKSLTSSRARCGTFLAQRLDLLETRVSGPTGLTYDSASNQYVFNWKAPSLGCYTLFLTLDNNQVYTANFIIL